MSQIQDIDYSKESEDVLESVCSAIVGLDPKVRFVGIINDKDKLLAQDNREGMESFVDPKDQEVLFMEIALGVRMRREHDLKLGPVDFTISHGAKVVSMNFPLSKEILCVSAEKEIDVMKLTSLILNLLKTTCTKGGGD
jgi:hypothetical protein